MKVTKESNLRNDKEKNKKIGENPIFAQRGITLIALIITIIVMLILVAVTITIAVNGGLFGQAGRATKETHNAINAEQQLANGGITIGDTHYNSIDDYLYGPKLKYAVNNNLIAIWLENSDCDFYQRRNYRLR